MSGAQQWNFKYSLERPPRSELFELSLAEAEEVLLNNVRAGKDHPIDSLWQLARFYSHSQQHEKALEYLRKILALQPDPEDQAATVLAMGQTMEQVQDYAAAVRYYREAFALEPLGTHTWYFINNNLGYSLNALGQFAEGEPFCRAAIAIDARRPNGFKNLGMSLQGQGRFAEAAECFVKSTQANASDPRALTLLEDLLKQQPELEFEFGPQLEVCREAVAVARNQQALLPRPVIRRGWRKRLFMLKTRLVAGWRRVWKR